MEACIPRVDLKVPCVNGMERKFQRTWQVEQKLQLEGFMEAVLEGVESTSKGLVTVGNFVVPREVEQGSKGLRTSERTVAS